MKMREVAWCSEVFVWHDSTFNVVRESVGSTFSVSIGVSVGIGASAGIAVCILLVPSCAVKSVGSMFGIGTGVFGIGDGTIVCILFVPSCTV